MNLHVNLIIAVNWRDYVSRDVDEIYKQFIGNLLGNIQYIGQFIE